MIDEYYTKIPSEDHVHGMVPAYTDLAMKTNGQSIGATEHITISTGNEHNPPPPPTTLTMTSRTGIHWLTITKSTNKQWPTSALQQDQGLRKSMRNAPPAVRIAPANCAG